MYVLRRRDKQRPTVFLNIGGSVELDRKTSPRIKEDFQKMIESVRDLADNLERNLERVDVESQPLW